MNNEQKEIVAIFRFGVIFPLVECNIREYWGEKERILNWLKNYEAGVKKIEALYPQDRGDRGRSRSIDDETVEALILMRKENPKISVPRLIEKANSPGMFPPGKEVSAATIYRLMKLHELKTKKQNEDMRKFEVQMSNDLWQSDCMHGPKILYEGKMRKTYLFAIIDDHSRLIPHGQFYMAETLDNYLDCLWAALKKRGVPRKLYVGNGPSFRAHRLQLGCASLGIGLSYARPYGMILPR